MSPPDMATSERGPAITDCIVVSGALGSRSCGDRLSGSDPAPWRHRVWDLPEIRPLVTVYQRHRRTCAGCGETTCGELREGVPHSQAGPRLVALTVL